MTSFFDSHCSYAMSRFTHLGTYICMFSQICRQQTANVIPYNVAEKTLPLFDYVTIIFHVLHIQWCALENEQTLSYVLSNPNLDQLFRHLECSYGFDKLTPIR